MDNADMPTIRTAQIKQILDAGTDFEVIEMCQDLSKAELDFIRVHLEIVAKPKRGRPEGSRNSKPRVNGAAAVQPQAS